MPIDSRPDRVADRPNRRPRPEPGLIYHLSDWSDLIERVAERESAAGDLEGNEFACAG